MAGGHTWLVMFECNGLGVAHGDVWVQWAGCHTWLPLDAKGWGSHMMMFGCNVLGVTLEPLLLNTWQGVTDNQQNKTTQLQKNLFCSSPCL